MKRPVSILLTISLLLALTACGNQEETRFYYARKEILYGESNGVIASEVRDVSGHEKDLTYLLMLYLEGPHSQELTAPFPRSTSLSQLEIQEQEISIVLSEAFGHLQGLDLTIACTCIAYTCFAISDCESVTIRSSLPDAPSITLTRDSVAFADNSPISETQ